MTHAPIRILIQTTIPKTKDDWSIVRFSRLGALLRSQKDSLGNPLFDVTMRDRGPLDAPDSMLANIDNSEFDELWLFAVDVGNGLTDMDCEAISRFRENGGGLLVTRDHMDLGSSICDLSGVGRAHHFHTRNLPDPSQRCIDDPFTKNISWPNFHSGANGDFQRVEVVEPLHPVLKRCEPLTGSIRHFPSHPHEGSITAPEGENARVIAMGTSRTTGRRFNTAVAFERTAKAGRAIAQSTFHHFANYNWNPEDGAPSFVDEPPGDAIVRTPEALADIQCYVVNVAKWLAPERR